MRFGQITPAGAARRGRSPVGRPPWDAAGAEVLLGTADADGLALELPITAPNLPTLYAMTGATTNATPARLTTNGAAAGASNIGPVVDNASNQHARLVRRDQGLHAVGVLLEVRDLSPRVERWRGVPVLPDAQPRRFQCVLCRRSVEVFAHSARVGRCRLASPHPPH